MLLFFVLYFDGEMKFVCQSSANCKSKSLNLQNCSFAQCFRLLKSSFLTIHEELEPWRPKSQELESGGGETNGMEGSLDVEDGSDVTLGEFKK